MIEGLTGLRRDELEPGRARVVDLGGAKVLLIRIGDEVRATSAWCTHAQTELGDQIVDDDGLIECPMHGAVFSSADGSLQIGPTCDPLPVYRVTLADDETIVVHLSESVEAKTVANRPVAGAWDFDRVGRGGPIKEDI